MQFHLNGFKPGNYQIPDAARKPAPIPPIKDLPKEVDVLIVGCGPAGLALARQLAEFPDISTCIVEQKAGPMLFVRPMVFLVVPWKLWKLLIIAKC